MINTTNSTDPSIPHKLFEFMIILLSFFYYYSSYSSDIYELFKDTDLTCLDFPYFEILPLYFCQLGSDLETSEYVQDLSKRASAADEEYVRFSLIPRLSA